MILDSRVAKYFTDYLRNSLGFANLPPIFFSITVNRIYWSFKFISCHYCFRWSNSPVRLTSSTVSSPRRRPRPPVSPSGLGTRGWGNAEWVKTPHWNAEASWRRACSTQAAQGDLSSLKVTRSRAISLTGDGEQGCAHCCDSYTYLPKVYSTINQQSSNPYLWPSMITRQNVLRITDQIKTR